MRITTKSVSLKRVSEMKEGHNYWSYGHQNDNKMLRYYVQWITILVVDFKYLLQVFIQTNSGIDRVVECFSISQLKIGDEEPPRGGKTILK